MDNNLVIPDELITNKIYLIRNQKVMLDKDLAELYQVETKRINEQIKRNSEKFQENFMFQLTESEFQKFEVAICDFKLGRHKKIALCLYRIWNFATRNCA